MDKRVVIICDGNFPKKDYPRYLIRTADYVICCDGALQKFIRNSKAIFGEARLPYRVIGDMDSLPASLKRNYSSIITQIDEQEHNDQTKAFKWVLENIEGVSEITFIGATGLREDHTVGNMSLLMEYSRSYDLEARGIQIQMVTDYSTILAITDSISIDCGSGREISLISPDNSLKISSEGLEWKTDEVVFDNWWKATLNRSTQDTVKLKFSHKSIALIIMN